jgi:hypothetical protein
LSRAWHSAWTAAHAIPEVFGVRLQETAVDFMAEFGDGIHIRSSVESKSSNASGEVSNIG